MDSKELVPVEQALVPFYGNEILAVRLPDGRIAASLNSLCKMLKLARHGQMERIRRDEDLIEYLLLAIVKTSGGSQRMEVLIAEAIPSWVMGIQEKLVAPEKRPLIRNLKIEVVIVLNRHFFGGQPAQPTPEPQAGPLPPPRSRPAASDSPRERLFEALREIELSSHTALEALQDSWEEEQARFEKLERVQSAQAERFATFEEWLRSLDRRVASSGQGSATGPGWIVLLSGGLFRLLEQSTGRTQKQLEQELIATFRAPAITAISDELWEDVLAWGFWRARAREP